MKPRTLGLALVAGLAAVLLVGIGVTELLQPRIEFSLLVGIPAGAVAGAVTAAAVARGVAGDGPGPRRVAFTVAAFGAAFLGTSVVMAVLVDPASSARCSSASGPVSSPPSSGTVVGGGCPRRRSPGSGTRRGAAFASSYSSSATSFVRSQSRSSTTVTDESPKT
jgi:hypothetical protein